MSGRDGGGYASKPGAQHATRYAAGSSRSAQVEDAPARSPEEIAEHQAHADLGRARSFVADAAQLAAAPREVWAAMRDDLAVRLDAFRERMRIAEERATTAAAKAARAPITDALDHAAATLAAATQPRAVRPLPGEIEIEPRIIAKAIDVDEVIDWYATLSQAQRGEVLDRYRNASSNRADTFAVALLNYGAPHQLAARLAPLAKLDRFRLAQWSAQRDAARPAAANDEPEHAEGVDRGASSSTAAEESGATAPGEVPHRAAMEGIFGASLGHVRAVTNDRALAARGIDGAAEGATVRFATATPAPDLVAHELTHVMQQQQAGAPVLALRDRSTPSDAAEVEARAVAGQVAAGDLSPVTVRAVPSAAVQLATPDATADARGAWDVPAPAYFGHNLSAILAAVRSQVADTDWPLGHARISWQAPPSDVAHVITHHLIALTGGHTADRMPHFAPFWHPVDLWSVVDSARPLTSGAPGAYKEGAPTAKGPMRGDASAAEAIAVEFVAALRTSFRRMVPRFVAAADDHRPEPVAAGQLVTSAPIDRLWAHVLTAPALVQHAAPTGARGEAPTPTGVGTFRGGPRPVAYEWMGATDPSMWNVLRVTSPSDATVEEVAAQLYQYPGSEAIHSHNAFAITDAAPFFVLPRAWAKELPDAARWASPAHASARAEPIDAVLQSSTVDAAALSQGADEAAHPLARKGKASRADVERMTAMLWRGDDQLAFIADQLAPWDLAAPIAAERAWLQRRVAELSHEAPDEAARWAPVVEAQQRTIMSATAAIAEVTDLARGAGIAPTSPSAAPVRRTLASYASAIATSHLADLARTRMATASDHRQQLALVGLNAVIADATSATESLRESEGGSYDPASDAGDLTHQRRDVQHGRNQLRARQLDGDATDPDQLDDLATKASMIAVRARAKELGIKAGALSAMLSRTQDSGTIAAMAAAFDSRFVTLPNQLEQLAYACQALAQNMDNADDETMLSRRPSSEPDDHAAQARQLRDLRKKALATAQADLAAIPVTYGLSRLNREAMDAIETNQIATLAVNVMILIAASVATSGIAAYAGGAARGFAVARFGLGADIGAPLVQGVTNVVVDSTLTAGVQSAVNGADFSDGLVENILANAGVRVALARFAPAMAGLDAEATAVWESGGSAAKAGVVMAKGAAVGAELITAAGVSYVAQRIMYGRQPPGDSEVAAWFIHGASMAVGRMVATRTTQINARMERAGIRAGTGHDGLMKRIDAQAALAARVTTVGHGDDAMRLLIENRALLDAEADVLRQLDADPSKAAALGMSAQDRAALSRDNDAARADTAAQGMEVLPLRLAGVDELIPGALWQGSSEDIATALYQARAVGLDVQVIEVGNRQKRWRVQFGKGARVIDIEEDAPRATAGKPARRPVAAIAPEARKLLHQKAAAELARMRVSVMPTEHTDRGYLVTPADGRRLAELFPDIEGAQTIEYRKGILVRLDGREWYFEFNDQAHTMTDQRATATDAANGLPDANVATVEVIGYSGARNAFGEKIAAGSPEAHEVAARGADDPLLIAGHVAISFDAGKTLWGFTPKVDPASGLTVSEVIDMLKAGQIFPGQVLDDVAAFRNAEQMAHRRAWDTQLHRYIVTLNPEARARLMQAVASERQAAPLGAAPHGYTFPGRKPADSSPYQPFRGGTATNGQGYATECVANCAVWPSLQGIPIPEHSGRMQDYMPPLRIWEAADAPIAANGDQESSP